MTQKQLFALRLANKRVYVITLWNVVLKLKAVKLTGFWVSDPEAVDAGQDIAKWEVKAFLIEK